MKTLCEGRAGQEREKQADPQKWVRGGVGGLSLYQQETWDGGQ